MPFSRLLLAFLLVGASAILAGCDSDGRDDRNVRSNVTVRTFTLGDTDSRGDFRFSLDVNGDFEQGIYSEVQYETDDRAYPDVAGPLTEAAVDGGIVLLYASDVVDAGGLQRSGWTALPLTLGYDEPTDSAPNGDGFIDYTLTTTYTYDIGRLFVNLVASDVVTIDFLDREEGLLANLEDIRFRLVVLPGGSFARGIDYSDYAAVQRAYGLPD